MTTPSPSSARGFTLIEMIITLCVFILLAGAVFSIFSATLESASSLEDNQDRNDQVTALGAWLKANLTDIPADGTLTSYRRESIPFHVTGVVWGAGNDLQALDLQTQANGEYTLRLTAYQPPPSTGFGLAVAGETGMAALAQFIGQLQDDDPSLSWRPLMRDLKSADWRFRRPNILDWQQAINGAKPAIAEFTFQPAGLSSVVTDDFWLPPTQPPGNLAIPSTAATAASTP